MAVMHISRDGQAFLAAVRPALERQDPKALAQSVDGKWTALDVRQLLKDSHVDVRRVAAVALGLIGSMDDGSGLVDALADADPQVNHMAEHALWSIWFRACSRQACRPFRAGVAAMASESYEKAVGCFEEAFAIDPDFAEAYNQCAIAHYFLGQWSQCLEDCDRTIERIPQHFGAILGKGHCYAQLGMLDDAMDCYREALKINPQMPAIEQAIDQIRRRLAAGPV